MNTKKNKVIVQGIEVDTINKDIKNMHLGVYPPKGRVRVAAPKNTSLEAIRLFVISKIDWIKKHRRQFLAQERQSKREYISGESHYFLGRRYRLRLFDTDKEEKIELQRRGYIDLYVKKGSSQAKKEKVMEAWYKEKLEEQISSYIQSWQQKTRLTCNEVKIKKMKTKWGSCIPSKKQIWMNLELAKQATHCIEYVFLHELLHLKVKDHNQLFFGLLDANFPNWRQCRDDLNNTILGHFEWKCLQEPKKKQKK